MLEFRVTKYDPAYRDASGSYTRDEWTSVTQIGRAFSGVVLTESSYQQIEDAYAGAAVAFMREAGIPSLAVAGLENTAHVPLSFAEGSVLDLVKVGAVVRRVLREQFWCRLEAPDAFIHIGWDYYMFLGVPRPCPGAETRARQLGLFVEPFSSPHRNEATE